MNANDELFAFCPACDGTGETPDGPPCEPCGGRGLLPVARAMELARDIHIDATERARTFWEDR